MKFPDYIALQNTLLVKELPKPLNEEFKTLNNQHQHATHSPTHNAIFVPKVHTETYRKDSIKYKSAKTMEQSSASITY